MAAAHAAIEQYIARPLGLDTLRAAEAILQVANARMAGAVRLVSVERGHDPKQFAYMPFGGGGALHVCAMMREVGVSTGIVPRYPGVTSALGCVIADMRHDQVRTLNVLLSQLKVEMLRTMIDEMAGSGRDLIRAGAVRLQRVDVLIELDMLYLGQSHTIAVPLNRGQTRSRAGIARAFESRYCAAFGQLLHGIDQRILNLRVAVIGRRRTFDLGLLAPQEHVAPAPGKRKAWVEGRWQSLPVYARLALNEGSIIAGPALFEQPDTTVYLEPGMHARVDRLGNLIITGQTN